MKNLTVEELVGLAKNSYLTPFQKGKFLLQELEDKEFLELVGSMLERLYGWPS